MENAAEELLDRDPFYKIGKGLAFLGDSQELLEELPDESINLVITSPPVALRHKEEYGNKDQEDWK